MVMVDVCQSKAQQRSSTATQIFWYFSQVPGKTDIKPVPTLNGGSSTQMEMSHNTAQISHLL